MENTMLQQRKQCRLVLFPLPFQGHINPMIQLANILHSKGFSISIVHTRFNSPDPFKHPHFTFHFISDGLTSDVRDKPLDPVLIIKQLNNNCAEPFRQCLNELLSDGKENNVKCIITDTNWYCAQEVADSLKLPRIVLRTSSICAFLAFAALPRIREKGYLSNPEPNIEEPIVELPHLKVKDIPTIDISKLEDLYQLVGDFVESSKKAFGLIFNTFKELEEHDLEKLSEQFLMPIFTIGPFHKHFSAGRSSLLTQDRSCISWLDTQAPKSVLYVSFGSVATMNQEKLYEMAWGLADSKQPFLWVVRPGLVHGLDQWLESLPNELLESINERGYVIKWAPQQEVLSHPAVGGFWTHNGWNSTLESVCEGVPMISSPFFGDQKVNARYVNDVWRIGIRLEKGFKREEIEKAIRRLMVDKEGEDMRQRIMCLKEKADLCLNVGGSSYRSLEGLVDFISSL
uniref:UDP-glycosyltransferase n=1 Tax=Scoparia dulcis TaxID=107240 RepID=A0A5H2Q857_SCODU|nr:UDP-glycosyltransferase [Scoparia dulcis]